MKHRRWFRIRAAVQVCCWLSFVAILVATRDPIVDGYLYGIFPRLSLHLGIATSLASRQFLSAFLPALAILALSLGIGRFFCSTVCPLGASIDARQDRGASARTAQTRNRTGPGALKDLTLAGSRLLALAGVQAPESSIRILSLEGTPRSYILLRHTIKLVFDGLLSVPVSRRAGTTVRPYG